MMQRSDVRAPARSSDAATCLSDAIGLISYFSRAGFAVHARRAARFSRIFPRCSNTVVRFCHFSCQRTEILAMKFIFAIAAHLRAATGYLGDARVSIDATRSGARVEMIAATRYQSSMAGNTRAFSVDDFDYFRAIRTPGFPAFYTTSGAAECQAGDSRRHFTRHQVTAQWATMTRACSQS